MTKFADKSSDKSKNLPLRICDTSLAGTGEKPGPTTNGWSAMELTRHDGNWAETPLNTCPDEEAIAGTGALKVDTKVGTTRGIVPPDFEELEMAG